MSLERFRKVYSLLPESEKKLTVVVIDNEPITWDQAYNEIKTNTELGKKIQDKLEELELI